MFNYAAPLVLFLLSMSTNATAQSLPVKTPGSSSEALAFGEAGGNSFGFSLAAREGLLVKITINTGLPRSCYEFLRLKLFNGASVLEEFDNESDVPALGSLKELSVAYVAQKAESVRVSLFREPGTEECSTSAFPYTLELGSFRGQITPTLAVDAKTGVYTGKLPFEDRHSYLISLPKSKTLQAGIRATSGFEFGCVNVWGLRLYDSRGREVSSSTTTTVGSVNDPSFRRIKFSRNKAARYRLDVTRYGGSDGSARRECNFAAFEYELSLKVPKAKG